MATYMNAETGELIYPYLDEQGREILDPTPMAPPLGYKRQPSLTEQIRMQVRSEALRFAAEQAGQETFEESDDFEIGDDYDPTSPYEEVFEPIIPVPKGETPSGSGGEGVSPSNASPAPSAPPTSVAPATPAPGDGSSPSAAPSTRP